MPAFYAMVCSGLAGFMADRLLRSYIGMATIPVALVVSILVFFYMKKLLNDLRP